MKSKIIILILTCSCLFFGCKKEYGWNVNYKVTIVPYSGQNLYSTDIEYIVKDNKLETERITSLQWEYNFNGKEDDNAYIKAINVSNVSSVKIEMNVNGSNYTNECSIDGCEVELKKGLN